MLTTLGAVVLVAQGVAAAATEQNTKYAGSTGDALSDGLLAAGLLLTLAGLEAVRRALSRRMAAAAIVGQVALLISILATMGRRTQKALDAVFVVGTLVWLVGLIAIAITAARRRERHWRAAIALPLAGLAALAFQDAGGGALLGLVWLVLRPKHVPRARPYEAGRPGRVDPPKL